MDGLPEWLEVTLRILLIVVLSWAAIVLLRRAVTRALHRVGSGQMRERLEGARAEQRVEALSGVLRSAVTFAVSLIATFVVLGELGIELAPLIAGAGVLGVALGFGSQSLVKDFLSGLFILVEDQYGVGDIVDLDLQTSGVVEAVTLRTTRLRSVDGTVWYVPNGEIRRVGNKSQHWSRALLDVEVAYSTDLDRAQGLIKRVADELWREDDDILEEPEMWGVEVLGANGVTLRLVMKTTPAEQWRISRELRRRVKAAFDAEGIEIPFPQQTIWHRGTAPG